MIKGIPADEFMNMGLFAYSLLYDCTGCQVQDLLTNRDAFAPPPRGFRWRGGWW